MALRYRNTVNQQRAAGSVLTDQTIPGAGHTGTESSHKAFWGFLAVWALVAIIAVLMVTGVLF